ncbi:hypothetical protein [Shewanella gaetbuli]
MRNNKNAGFGMAEYLVGLLVLMAVFFTPYINNQSVVSLLIDAIKKEHAGYIYAQSRSQFQLTKEDLTN